MAAILADAGANPWLIVVLPVLSFVVSAALLLLGAYPAMRGWQMKRATRSERYENVIEHVLGREPDPDTGEPGRPGLLDRVQDLEEKLAERVAKLEDRVDDLERETKWLGRHLDS